MPIELKIAITVLLIAALFCGYMAGRCHGEYIENKRLKERQKLKKV